MKNKDRKLDITEQIAHHFHDFYTNLYNLLGQHKPADVQCKRKQILQEYLNSSKLPKLTDINIKSLEKPIETLEIRQAIKDLKKGKSSGPDGFSSIYYKTFIDGGVVNRGADGCTLTKLFSTVGCRRTLHQHKASDSSIFWLQGCGHNYRCHPEDAETNRGKLQIFFLPSCATSQSKMVMAKGECLWPHHPESI